MKKSKTTGKEKGKSVLHTLPEDSIELKTLGQLIDELSIANIRVWMLIDKVYANEHTHSDAMVIQNWNKKRSELVRAIDRRLGQRDIGAKTYREE